MSRLLELENDGQAERRTGLTGPRFLSPFPDPDTGRAYVLRHGVDSTEGAELPEGEFFEYPNGGVAAQAYDLSLNRYKAMVHDDVEHRPPKEILTELAKFEMEIQRGMTDLEQMLK